MSSQYTQYKDKIQPLITRNNEDNDFLRPIQSTSFWLDDVETPRGSCVQIFETSRRNTLKVTQDLGQNCWVFPVDGNCGLFLKEGCEVSNPEAFVVVERHHGTTKEVRVGDCDCLIINSKFRFVEFKSAAISQNIDQINANYDKAIMQLAKTMTSFKEKITQEIRCECFVVVPKFYPRNFSPNRRIKFKKKFDVPLQIKFADNKDVLHLGQ